MSRVIVHMPDNLSPSNQHIAEESYNSLSDVIAQMTELGLQFYTKQNENAGRERAVNVEEYCSKLTIETYKRKQSCQE